MTNSMPASEAPPRRTGRSIAAIFTGFAIVFVLSLGTDQLFHALNVYPPFGMPMFDPGLNLLALAYRCVYTVLGGYVTARMAPDSPMRHVWTLAIIGLVLATIGAVSAMILTDLGPIWYPIALALIAVPCTWLGGALHRRMHSRMHA